jgi:hypothetical protein
MGLTVSFFYLLPGHAHHPSQNEPLAERLWNFPPADRALDGKPVWCGRRDRWEFLEESGRHLLPRSRSKPRITQHTCMALVVPMSAGCVASQQLLRGDSIHSGEERGSAGAGWGVGAGSSGASCQRIEGNRLGRAPGALLSTQPR